MEPRRRQILFERLKRATEVRMLSWRDDVGRMLDLVIDALCYRVSSPTR